jgi:UDP-glucose 4-epimerase
MRILVTGGAGYIGSHTCLELLTAGHDVVVVDNLSNSSEVSLQRVQELAGRSLKFYRSDLRDRSALDNLFSSESIDAVIHFAGLKAVGESLAIPHEYYDNNVGGTLVLAEAMARHAVFSIIFSSSATVYGDPASVPAREDFPLSATNPYGRTKLMIEQILGDLAQADPRWNVSLLRYFNPVGAHESGRIGEDPRGIPNNLMPYLCQVAVGKRDCVQIFGNDYPTPDGTGVRDYVHVVDLALGHIAALERHDGDVGSRIYNLGTGRGVSVLDLLRAVETASGTVVPYRVVERRTGDIAENFADCSLAAQELGWTAERDLAQMAADSWRWQSNNPGGYPD